MIEWETKVQGGNIGGWFRNLSHSLHHMELKSCKLQLLGGPIQTTTIDIINQSKLALCGRIRDLAPFSWLLK